MFGLVRYGLAIMVVIGHLWPKLVPNLGSYAVFGFYILSGYLISLVLHETYKFSFKGTLKFLSNRALRIYPPYFIATLMSLAIILTFKKLPGYWALIIQLPTSIIEWMKNIFIFGLTARPVPDHMLVGVAWTLYVELFFYVAMALFLVRHRMIVVLWFATSLIVTGFMVAKGYHFDARYYTIIGGSLPFSTGAMIYSFKHKLRASSTSLLPLAVILYIANIVLTRYLDVKYMLTPGLYISYALAALVIVGCMNIDISRTPNWLTKIDKFLGNLSYPIYLVHWQVAMSISLVFFNGTLERETNTLFLISVLSINIVAFGVYFLIEKNINIIRDSIKKDKLSGPIKLNKEASPPFP